MTENQRIYVIVPATVEVAKNRSVVQPIGRQFAQGCHVVSKLRMNFAATYGDKAFRPVTTIILQARDSKEMIHNYQRLVKRKLYTHLFSDKNDEAYGNFSPITACAVLATKKQVKGILDYLPLWGQQ